VHFAKKTLLAAAILAAILTASALAQGPAPAGLWRTFNERGQAESLVRITEHGGELRGEVVTVFSPPAPSGRPPARRCYIQPP